MQFLYHARPLAMRGDVLYPLNELRTRFPDLYGTERAKYSGREILFDLRIPLLEVLWNDALHLCPFPPDRLAAAWRAAGLTSTAWDRDFFEIPVDRIERDRAVVFASGTLGDSEPEPEQAPSLPVDQVARFDPSSYRVLERPPAQYLDYLADRLASGRPARPFAYLPHVLVAAPINVENLGVVRADE